MSPQLMGSQIFISSFSKYNDSAVINSLLSLLGVIHG
jgi:hypothetical protein